MTKMVADPRPGFADARLIALMRAAIDRCALDLDSLRVLTEAATGAYVVTPVLATLAGATHVDAITADSRYGTAKEVSQRTRQLARTAGVEDRITIHSAVSSALLGSADIVTNSGHLRPLDAQRVAAMKPTAALPLMYEAWELRPEDVDVAACRAHGIAVAGTCETHPAIDVFGYLGAMAVRLLHDAGIAVYRSRVLVVSDNPFGSRIQAALEALGARAELVRKRDDGARQAPEALLIATTPTGRTTPDPESTAALGRWPTTALVHYWGDPLTTAEDPRTWPPGVTPGHMGILPSAIGPEAIVRLQAGGLAVGALLARARRAGADPDDAVAHAVQQGWANAVGDA